MPTLTVLSCRLHQEAGHASPRAQSLVVPANESKRCDTYEEAHKAYVLRTCKATSRIEEC